MPLNRLQLPRAAAPLLALVPLLAATPARADEEAEDGAKLACVASLDRAQSLQSARRLIDARAEYVACSAETCPEVVREDCARSLLAVDAALPTLVYAAEVDGRDASDVRVLVDGALASEVLDGRSFPVDPGPHVVRFERASGAVVETRIVAREGDKNRLVTGAFTSPVPAIRAERPRTGRAPVVPIVLGGTGALALGGALALRLSADARAADLRASCAPACDPAERAALSDRIVASNVALGIGIGALALSAATWILEAKR